MARSKRIRAIHEQVEPGKVYEVDEALGLLRSLSKVKFTESVDVAVRLGVDPRKSDQTVRGALVLPHGTGKTVRVAVFAQGDNAEKAKAAGADIVGMEDLAETIQGGQIDFDVCIATPDAMRIVGRLGQILGPRGLMPNPRVGTVTTDVESAVGDAKAGQVQYRTDKGGIVHATIGKVDFEVDALRENLQALVSELVRVKPPSSRGHYLRKIAVSTTMGPGLAVDSASLGI
ncbi:MAG TPA: 50S ribosomal protein L1 [Wenzhouxiangella sp.]|nr:50S ribosomal protein L1 [Wenzhouxiangella sp.]